jgi:hypothetical protein
MRGGIVLNIIEMDAVEVNPVEIIQIVTTDSICVHIP